MSTKTLKQRIALVAVSALTAGVLSVASTPVANAAAGTGVLEVTAATSTGICAVNNGTTGAPIAAAATYENAAYGTVITVAAGLSFTVEPHDSEKVIIKGSAITISAPGTNQTVAINAA
jgi:hypothetical protein